MNVNPFHERSIDDQLAQLHKEMRSLRVECDRLVQSHLENETAYVCGQQETSSAYNTGGESCRSNSVTPDSNIVQLDGAHLSVRASPRVLHRSHQLLVPAAPSAMILPQASPNLSQKSFGIRRTVRDEIDEIPCAPSVSNLQQRPVQAVTPTAPSSTVSTIRKKPPTTIVPLICCGRSMAPSPSHYHIPLVEAMRGAATKEKHYVIESPPSNSKQNEEKGETTSTVNYKWKVKRRADGSRYVVKRPIRSQVLKKREAQLLVERGAFSTDDDAHSGIKLGRFQSKEERRRQLEKEKRRKEKILQQKQKLKQPDQLIIQLAEKKMQKQKEKLLLDGFVTTQEVLSQRNTTSGKQGGFISVTTV